MIDRDAHQTTDIDIGPVLYMSGTLPKRSETFVYREILALRELGIQVFTASVHASAHGLDNGPIEDIANSTVQVYSHGASAIIKDFIAEMLSHPVPTIKTSSRCICDALFSSEVSMSRKPKVVWQGLAAIALAKRVRGLRIRHIHSHMAHVPTTISMYTAQQLGVTFSFTGHANDLFPNRTLLKEKLQRSVFTNCISLWHRQFYQDIVTKPDERYPVVRCGVDTRKYDPTDAPNQSQLTVLSVGRLVEKKGFDVLIRAAGQIAEQGHVKLRVIIAGGGPEGEMLKDLVKQLPALAEVEMLGDTDNEQIMELMGKVDVFALPCRVASTGDRDGIPVVLMEAMARGRCVVSGDLETIRELIEHDVSGIMIPPGDQESLVEFLIELAQNREKLTALGKAARLKIESEFDLMLNAQRIQSTMQRFLSQGKQ